MNGEFADTGKLELDSRRNHWRGNAISWLSASLLFACSLVLAFLRESAEILNVTDERVSQVVLAVAFTGLALTITTLPKRLSRIERALVKLRNMINLSNQESSLLRSLELIRSSTPKSRTHLRAGLDVLRRLQKLNSVENLNKLEDLYHRRKLSVVLEDKSLAFLFLKHILEEFQGGVWLGVTRLTSKARWTQKKANEEFSNFRSEMHRRSNVDIQVFRIYYFSNPDDFESMKQTLTRERDHGVVVRYILDKREDDADPLPDMSLLWERSGPKVRLDEAVIGNLTIDGMEKRGFSACCGIRFNVVSNEELKEVTVNEPNSDEFKTLLRKFCDAWLSPETKPWP